MPRPPRFTTFVGRFNRARRRVGHLWQGRFRSTIIEQDTYFFRCMTYVDLNRLRAGRVVSLLPKHGGPSEPD
jgi:REP element-mobilizing transposase RayT